MSIRIHYIAAIAIMSLTPALAQDVAAESKIRIGVMNFSTANADPEFIAHASQALVKAVAAVGIYDAYSQTALEDIFAQLKIKFPMRCRDPRCVRDVGRTAGMDRMLFGVMDKNDQTFGIRLELLDVMSKQIIESVSLESAPGATMEDVVRAAVEKLHGHPDRAQDIKLSAYDGPQVHHEKEWLISSAACLGAGLVWVLANGGFGGGGSIPATFADSKVRFTGISGLGEGVPMGGRPGALANSYLAVSDDAYGVLHNPAGVAWVTNAELSIAYQLRYGLLNNITATYVNKATREIGFGQAFRYVGDAAGLMTETYFTSAVAYKLSRLLPFLRPLSLGAAVRLACVSVKAQDDVATAEGAGSGLGLDAGLLWELSNQIRYGLVFKDLLSFLHWNNTAQEWAYGEFCPLSLNMGGAFKAGYTTLLVANGQIPLYADQPWKMAGGIEQELFRIIKIRLGLEKQIQSELETPWRFTGGVGIDAVTESLVGKYASLDVSYEYNFPIEAFYVVNVSGRFGF